MAPGIIGPAPSAERIRELFYYDPGVGTFTRIVTRGSTAQAGHIAPGIKGVSWDSDRSRWVAQIKAGGRNIYLGRFNSQEQATAARVAGERKYFGEYARAK